MKIQAPTEFLTFNDGYCDIYSVKGNKLDEKLMHLCFGNRVVGYKRHFAARAANNEINRIIQIPIQLSVTEVNRAVVENHEYRIEQVQQLHDTNPPVTVLTLRMNGSVS